LFGLGFSILFFLLLFLFSELDFVFVYFYFKNYFLKYSELLLKSFNQL